MSNMLSFRVGFCFSNDIFVVDAEQSDEKFIVISIKLRQEMHLDNSKNE